MQKMGTTLENLQVVQLETLVAWNCRCGILIKAHIDYAFMTIIKKTFI